VTEEELREKWWHKEKEEGEKKEEAHILLPLLLHSAPAFALAAFAFAQGQFASSLALVPKLAQWD